MASASRAAASRPTLNEAARYLAGSLAVSEEDLVDVGIPRLCQYAHLALAVSPVVSVGAEVASEETEGSEEGSIDHGAEEDSVVATEASAARTAMAGHPTPLVDPAMAEVDTAAVLTAIAETVVVVAAAAAAMDDVTTTGTAAVIVAAIDRAPVATQSQLAHDTAAPVVEAPVVGAPVVGIATETTGATTPASDLTREAHTRASANSDDTEDKTTACLVVGILSPLISLFSSSHLFHLRQRG